MKPLSKFAISVGIFTIIGPLVGNAVLGLWLALEGGFAELPSVFVLTLGLAYFSGILPACTAGILFGAIINKYNLRSVPSIIIGLMAGAATTALISSLLYEGISSREEMNLLVSIGAISGAICGLIVWRIVREVA
ncbi:MAG: hypothetical protein LBE22_09890 [Azoarcus sp.]|jgi:hypothetical protein|nr:hypothetical protein [Azoarcus sp.]